MYKRQQLLSSKVASLENHLLPSAIVKVSDNSTVIAVEQWGSRFKRYRVYEKNWLRERSTSLALEYKKRPSIYYIHVRV